MIFLYLFLAFLLGYIAAVIIFAKDKDLIKLKANEVIVKKPGEGLVLVAVPPDVMRKLIMEPVESNGTEARTLYPRKSAK